MRGIGYTNDDSLGIPNRVVGVSEEGPIVYYVEGGISPAKRIRYAAVAQTSWKGEILQPLARLPADPVYLFTTPEGGLGLYGVHFARISTFRYSASGMLYSGYNESIDIAITSMEGEATGFRTGTP